MYLSLWNFFTFEAKYTQFMANVWHTSYLQEEDEESFLPLKENVCKYLREGQVKTTYNYMLLFRFEVTT